MTFRFFIGLLALVASLSLAVAAPFFPAQYEGGGMMGPAMMHGQGPMGGYGRRPLGRHATGRQVYAATCSACHATGMMGAPIVGSVAEWAPRIAQGRATLYRHAIHGFRAMPPKGGNLALTNREIRAAVDYMVSQVRR